MSKNKKWKRQAKKLLGECIKHEKESCMLCNAKDICYKNFCYTGYVPIEFGIRTLEDRCKYTNIYYKN